MKHDWNLHSFSWAIKVQPDGLILWCEWVFLCVWVGTCRGVSVYLSSRVHALFSRRLAVSFPDLTHVCSLMWITGSLSLSCIFPSIPLFLFVSAWEWVLLMWQEFGDTLGSPSVLLPTDFPLSIYPSIHPFCLCHPPIFLFPPLWSVPVFHVKEGVCGLRQPWLQLQFISINLIWVFVGACWCCVWV